MSGKRQLLEVLKWTAPADVLRHAGTVSKLWSRASDEDELWISLSLDANISPTRSEAGSYKDNFRLLFRCLLPVLTEHSFSIFNCMTRKVVSQITFSKGLPDDYSSAAVQLPQGELIVCGGRGDKVTFLISTSGEVTSLASMLQEREFHSMVLWSGVVYVFGGVMGEKGKSAEKLRAEPISEIASWEELPDSLVTHAACFPCVHGGLIYLCGGNTMRSEVFDTVASEYRLLDFTLPECLFGCAAFLQNDELIMFTQNFVSRWRPGAQLTSVSVTECPGIWTSMAQCLKAGRLYSSEKGIIRVFDLQLGTRTNCFNDHCGCAQSISLVKA